MLPPEHFGSPLGAHILAHLGAQHQVVHGLPPRPGDQLGLGQVGLFLEGNDQHQQDALRHVMQVHLIEAG